MGLPLFITPIEPEAASTTVDKTAARPRSSIRRQRTIRRLSRLRPSDRDAGRPRSSLAQDSAPADGTPQELRERFDPNGDTEPWPVIVSSNTADDEWARRPRPSVFRTTRDALPRPSADIPEIVPYSFFSPPYSQPPNMPPVPPVPDTAELRSRHASRLERRGHLLRLYEARAGLRRLARQQPTPLRSENTSAPPSNSHSPRLPALTPDFSPARRFVMNEASRNEVDREVANTESPWADEGNQSTDDLPPLRRMGRRSIADYLMPGVRPRIPRLDGLGDRDRSLSPDADNAWDTLLTSITPDPQPPSVGSSFASTSAAMSASSNPASSATSLTAMDSTGDPSFENACDIIEDGNDMSDTEIEEDEDIYELPGDSHTVRDRFWRSYADVVVARADRVARSVLPETDPLGGMQRIVRRLARREDIPDEWWAEVGLSRTFPHQSSS